jgi:hypothetical protein
MLEYPARNLALELQMQILAFYGNNNSSKSPKVAFPSHNEGCRN